MTRASENEPIWLVSSGTVLASAWLATTRADRRRGLIGQTSIDAPLVIKPCNWVHSFGMKVPIDVLYVGEDGTVLHSTTLKPWRVGPRVPKSAFVVEAAAGSLERWHLTTPAQRADARIEVRHAQH